MKMNTSSANQLASEVVNNTLSVVPRDTLPPILLFVDFIDGVYRPSIWYRGANNAISMDFPKTTSMASIIALCESQQRPKQIKGWAELTILIESSHNFIIRYTPPDTPEVELDFLPEGRSELVAREYFGNGEIQFMGTQ
jgi:hypothetical protein